MKPQIVSFENPGEEISQLVQVFQQTVQRLQDLTGGELDSVLLQGGGTYLLQEAQEKLRQSEARQREAAATQTAILNALPAHIALMDHRGVILSVNDGWRKFAGDNTLEDAAYGVGKNYLEICDRSHGRCEDESQTAAAGIRAVLSGALPQFSLEYPCHTSHGPRWFRLVVNPLPNGDLGGVVVMHVDTTERKQAEELLRISEERFRNMFAAAATGIATSTPQGRFLECNPAYCQMLGYTLDELRALNFASLTHPEDLTLNLHLRDEVLAGKRDHFTLEKRYLKKTGETVWTRHSVSATRTAAGEITAFIVVAEDITQARQAQEKLQLKQNELQVLFDLMPAMVWFKDTQNGILRVNQRAAAATGKTVAEIEGKSMFEIFPRDAAKYLADDLEVIRTGASKLEIIEPLHDLRGNAILVQTDKVPVRDHTGQVTGIVVMAQDVTARKRTETRFRRLVDSNAQSVIFWNASGKITDSNDAFLTLTGYNREDLTSGCINWVNMTPPEFAHLDQHALREIAATGTCATYEKEFIRKDGSRVPILLGSAAFEDNPQEGVCFALDLTERVKTEKALRLSEKRFKALFEQAAVGVALTDALTGRFLQVNQRYCEITGRPREVMEMLTVAAITHPDHVEREQELLGQARAGTLREFTVEKRYVRPDGSEVWVGATLAAMWAPGDPPDFFMAVVQDITTRRHLEDSFRQAQKMEAMGTLAGGIAHDFNNILASINGYTHLAKMVMVGNAEVREYLDAVLQAGERASALVKQILAFSRQEQLQRAPVELGPILKETLKLLRATIPATTEFVITLAPDAPPVLADANQIHQIMMNLGTNAWHALPEGAGRIEFRLESCLVDELYVARQPRLRPGRYARVSVSDTGCGMSEATLGRIFEPFFTTKPTGEGTGLGLSVVHGIMETHDGIVTVESQPGVGTVFHLYFPALSREAAATALELEPVPAGSGERILLVDDEELLAKLGHKMLSNLGYDVMVTTQPLVALEMVRADPSRFALVITDQTMPGMTGLGLASQLLKIRPGLPIILMTGFSLIVTPEAVRVAGIHQLLLKPASLHALGSAIHAALSNPVPIRP
jgi:PAS domain S-box-containing protein